MTGSPSAGLRFAVLGSPIAHSKSPALHAAAHRVLGLDWRFDAVEVREGELAGFLDTIDEGWRGLAITMPLKREVMDHLDTIDRVARLAGAVNTVLFDDGLTRGFNTDVYGVTRALTELGVPEPRSVTLFGAGATAASVIVAVAQLGATQLQLVARSPERAARAASLAESMGLAVTVGGFDSAITRHTDVVISTLPAGAELGAATIDHVAPVELRQSAPLLDIAYGAVAGDLRRAWVSAGARAESGLTMLLHQAVQQVRVFVGGDPLRPLDNEVIVVEAMRAVL